MKALLKPALTAICVAALFTGWLAWQVWGLPSQSELRIQQSRRVQDLRWTPLSAISPRLQAAVLVSEDAAFYQHRGFNLEEMRIAMVEDVRAGYYRRGASTITQQVAREMLATRQKTLRRKLREAILARRLEQVFSKREILEIYLNMTDWGDGIAGAEAAARVYLGKSAGNLTWADAALLAGMLPNPHRLSPVQSCDRALWRRDVVLEKLQIHSDISPDERAEALAAECPQNSNVGRAGLSAQK